MTNSPLSLPPLPSDGPVNPGDHPEGIVWTDMEIDHWTGKTIYVTRVISVDEWNRDYAMDAKEIEAFKAACAAREAEPFRFVDPDKTLRFYGDDKGVSLLLKQTARQSGEKLNGLLDQLKENERPPVWLKRHIRQEATRLIAEVAAQRQANLALRQQVADLKAQPKPAPKAAAEATGAREVVPATSQ